VEPVILVAEDDLHTRESLGRALVRAGYRTLSARDGIEALAVLRREPVDVLLTDLKMPGADGMALLERARTESPDIPTWMTVVDGDVYQAGSVVARLGEEVGIRDPGREWVLVPHEDQVGREPVVEG